MGWGWGWGGRGWLLWYRGADQARPRFPSSYSHCGAHREIHPENAAVAISLAVTSTSAGERGNGTTASDVRRLAPTARTSGPVSGTAAATEEKSSSSPHTQKNRLKVAHVERPRRVKVIFWTRFWPPLQLGPIIKSDIRRKNFGSHENDDNEIRGSGISEKSLLTFLTEFQPKLRRFKITILFVSELQKTFFFRCDMNVLPLFCDKKQNQLYSLIQLPK